MNLNLVSSQHAKETFERSQFNIEEKGQVKGQIQLQKPIEVLFEGADLTKYFPTTSKFDLSAVKEEFAYLFVGHWLQGNFGQDRKNVGYMVKVFLEVFKNKKNQPALILKTQSANASILDRDQLLKKIDDIRKTVKGTLPNIYLIHGEMSDEEINYLYNHPKVKAMVSFTKGEGFGRPLLFCYLVNGTLTNVDKSAVVEKMILKESQWFTPTDTEAATALRLVYDNYKKYAELAKRQGYKSHTNFSWEKMAEQLDQILSSNLPEFAKQVQLKLPTLQLPKMNKVEEGPKLNLPKLKKIDG